MNIDPELLDALLFIILIGLMLISIFVQFAVFGAYNKYSNVRTGTMTGAEAARQMLQMHGVGDITFTRTNSQLGDHFNPRKHTIALSSKVIAEDSVSALAIACHEAGHAIQYHNRGVLISIRMMLAPVAIISNYLAWIVLMIGFLLLYLTGNYILLVIGTALLGVLCFYALITLPIEFDASRKAIKFLTDSYILRTDEQVAGAKKVLRSASYTYVVAFLVTLVQFVRFVNIINSRRR